MAKVRARFDEPSGLVALEHWDGRRWRLLDLLSPAESLEFYDHVGDQVDAAHGVTVEEGDLFDADDVIALGPQAEPILDCPPPVVRLADGGARIDLSFIDGD